MRTWTISQEYLRDLRKNMLGCLCAAALCSWSIVGFTLTTFAKHDLWRPIMATHPVLAMDLVLDFVAIAATPLLGVLLLRILMARARVTSVALLEDRLVKRVHEEECVPLAALSEIFAVRSWNGRLKTVRCLTRTGSSLTVDGLDDCDAFLQALQHTVPHCPVRKWTVPRRYHWIWCPVSVTACLLLVADLHHLISRTVFYGALLSSVMLAIWCQARMVPRGFRRWSEQALWSSHLGTRYRWLDLAFGGLVLYLFVGMLPEAGQAIREGRWADLLSLSFTPCLLTWFYLVPLVRAVRRRRADWLVLVGMLSLALGLQWMGARSLRAPVSVPAGDAAQGLRYVADQRYAKAIPPLERAYRRDPRQSDLGEHLAYAYSMIGKPDEAIRVLDALIRQPGEPSTYAWELLMRTCHQTGQWRRLLDAAETVIAVHPRSAPAYHAAGLAASQLYGLRSPEARRYYAQYRALNPNKNETAFVQELFPYL